MRYPKQRRLEEWARKFSGLNGEGIFTVVAFFFLFYLGSVISLERELLNGLEFQYFEVCDRGLIGSAKCGILESFHKYLFER